MERQIMSLHSIPLSVQLSLKQMNKTKESCSAFSLLKKCIIYINIVVDGKYGTEEFLCGFLSCRPFNIKKQKPGGDENAGRKFPRFYQMEKNGRKIN